MGVGQNGFLRKKECILIWFTSISQKDKWTYRHVLEDKDVSVLWPWLVEETGVSHQPWMGNHYRATYCCSFDKHGTYLCAIHAPSCSVPGWLEIMFAHVHVYAWISNVFISFWWRQEIRKDGKHFKMSSGATFDCGSWICCKVNKWKWLLETCTEFVCCREVWLQTQSDSTAPSFFCSVENQQVMTKKADQTVCLKVAAVILCWL